MKHISDNHVHTSFSVDSNCSMDAMINRAIELNIEYITFTEHVDYNEKDDGYYYYQYEDYSEAIKKAKDTYGHQITILKGIEFGEPHIYKKEFEMEKNREYDVILGSVHWCGDYFYGSRQLLVKYKAEDIIKKYYEDVSKMVDYGGFDIVAHIDFPHRYFSLQKNDINIVKPLLEQIIQEELVLGVNTSGFRKGYQHTMPHEKVLAMYCKIGGKKISIGSDAHAAEELTKGFNQVDISEKLKNCIFINRNLIML